MSSSVDDLTDLILNQLRNRQNKQENDNKRSEHTYQNIISALEGEYDSQKQVEGNIQFTLFGAKRLLTFDNHTIEKIPFSEQITFSFFFFSYWKVNSILIV